MSNANVQLPGRESRSAKSVHYKKSRCFPSTNAGGARLWVGGGGGVEGFSEWGGIKRWSPNAAGEGEKFKRRYNKKERNRNI